MALRAKDVHEHFRALGTWVDWEHTCDGFKYGDPDTVVTGIAVSWQSLQEALEEARDKGCNLFITHEPTFYSHLDDDEALKATEPAQRKMAFLCESGMVVYRCHDVWDVYPKLGIVDAWSAFLGLGEPAATAKYYNLHEVPMTTAWELAFRIAQQVRPLGQQAVEFVGERWQMVSKLAVGTGAITNVRKMVDLGADVVLTTDDGIAYWRDGAWIADMGLPMIVVNHRTAEIPGLHKLAKYLGERFQVPVEFVGRTCSYEIYATERERGLSVHMRRDDLEDLPPLEIPAGYTLRPMAADEAWAYIQVMNRSNYAGEIGEEWFEQQFSSDPEYDPSYLQIIWKGKEPVAAAGAWHREIEGERWGMIHWVGVVREERGKGLGKAVTLAALHKLKERGFSRAMLG
ncbi:MAG: Nif3-like dinuclear metal center hexameric protein, partial [Chloroflexi bacterium]|nr:Nif3-like dinuclear metal center hexameric protein [Chloroflexota bacterium]